MIPAGGEKYFPCAWVLATRLRALGCTLPIEFWHLGEWEMDEQMRQLASELGAECVNASRLQREHPVRQLHGWGLKPYAILHSKFREVLLLDADNVPVRDPTFLFDSAQFNASGAVFWPDYGRLQPDRLIWTICDVPYRDEPEFESGQVLVDKQRCWNALQLTMHMNEHSEFYYQHIHGDKDTFHMSWRMLNQPYAMIPHPIHRLPCVMCQHDFDGKRLFQHRNLDKWTLKGRNARIRDFIDELHCFNALEDLRKRWDGVVRLDSSTDRESRSYCQEIVEARYFCYERVGYDSRPMEFLPDGTIGLGTARLERAWCVRRTGDGEPVLWILGESLTCILRRELKNRWIGKWESYEQMPINLSKFEPPNEQSIQLDCFNIIDRPLVYERVGHDCRPLRLASNGCITVGAGEYERVWWTHRAYDGTIVLSLGSWFEDPVCELIQQQNGVWRGYWNRFERMPIAVRPATVEAA